MHAGPLAPAADPARQQSAYLRFFAMLGVSGAVVYGLTYLHTYSLDHLWFSQTRLWMVLIMVAGMAVVMLAFMRHMYRDRKVNLAILGGAAVLLAGSVWGVRSQQTVGDAAYMKGMILHHSIAILTSSRAQIGDPRVRELANEIIAAQVEEIGRMEALIADIEAGDGASAGR